MPCLPTGTVTLLFSDIEGSTHLLQRLGERYASVLAEHRRLLRTAFREWGGHEIDTAGGGFFVAFERATHAVAAAVAAQHALAAHLWAEGPFTFPSLKTLDSRPNNLPAQLTSFVGRSQEAIDAQELLRQPEVRLLTFTGPGGSGKTRLTLHVAAEWLDDFTSGVFFVPLAPISDAHLVASTIAQILGVWEDGRPGYDWAEPCGDVGSSVGI